MTKTEAWADGPSSSFVVLCAFFGCLVTVALARYFESYGCALLVVAPLVIGLVLGAASGRNEQAVRWATGLGALLLAGVVTVTSGIAGLFCTITLLLYAVAPLGIGMFVGWRLQRRFARLGRKGQTSLCVALLVLPAPGLVLEARSGATGGVEVVRTVRVVDLAPAEAWSNLVFYEEVRLPPPLLARIGLPHPLYTVGEADRVGALKRCVCDGGYLTKRITEAEPGRRLAFEVLEQHGIEDRSIDLVDGRFELAAAGDGRTRITLTTRYLPLLEARGFWRPFEHRVTRALHEHVIAGIAAGPASRPPFGPIDDLTRGEMRAR